MISNSDIETSAFDEDREQHRGSEHTSDETRTFQEDRLHAQKLALEDPCWCLHRRGSLPLLCEPELIPTMNARPVAYVGPPETAPDWAKS